VTVRLINNRQVFAHGEAGIRKSCQDFSITRRDVRKILFCCTVRSANLQISISTLALLMGVASSQPVYAQSRADKPVTTLSTQPMRFIVPNAAGGPTDTVARVVGQKLAEWLGVAVVIDNRPGASGTVGGELLTLDQQQRFCLHADCDAERAL
jgi:Tripartite tricarboxylate transporter family receptor